jgi:type VI protein secretion system component VasF
MKNIKPNPSTINRSSLYKEMSHLRNISLQESPSTQESNDSEEFSLLRYFKWVGVLSIVALLVGFFIAVITH